MRRNVKAQSLLEYGLVVMAIIAALTGIYIYFSRAMQEKYRQSADVFGYGKQFAKGETIRREGGAATNIPPPEDLEADICTNIVARVTQKENLINGYTASDGQHVKGLLELADDLDRSAEDIASQRTALDLEQLPAGTSLPGSVQTLRNQAADLRIKAASEQAGIDSLKTEYSECFE